MPWKHLDATPEVPALMRSYDQALVYDFDIYVPGHGQTGTKEDIKIQQEYVNNAEYQIVIFIKIDFSLQNSKYIEKSNF